MADKLFGYIVVLDPAQRVTQVMEKQADDGDWKFEDGSLGKVFYCHAEFDQLGGGLMLTQIEDKKRERPARAFYVPYSAIFTMLGVRDPNDKKFGFSRRE